MIWNEVYAEKDFYVTGDRACIKLRCVIHPDVSWTPLVQLDFYSELMQMAPKYISAYIIKIVE